MIYYSIKYVIYEHLANSKKQINTLHVKPISCMSLIPTTYVCIYLVQVNILRILRKTKQTHHIHRGTPNTHP